MNWTTTTTTTDGYFGGNYTYYPYVSKEKQDGKVILDGDVYIKIKLTDNTKVEIKITDYIKYMIRTGKDLEDSTKEEYDEFMMVEEL